MLAGSPRGGIDQPPGTHPHYRKAPNDPEGPPSLDGPASVISARRRMGGENTPLAGA
jgi:hypothetical protein